ncbi:DUF1648 domain-containing protein [Paraclostridium sordellii]|uniref:DUF1648 domain-containing protein n=1 Tax=Paraclostridium sordellii TaxID=1505 RepID=UPI0005E2BE49|nr:DUF1648 domain-containing protein [Paeniclostridium sordellii]CEP42171.1 Predicted integral membrane protein [[Clostridium] sordellii] [Paeniclostridium sordellii]
MKRNKYDVGINFICLILLFGISIYLYINWNKLPDKIPGHYNFLGVVDRWGTKEELLLLPIIGWIVYISMTVVGAFPQFYQVKIKITPENKDCVYNVLRNMVNTLKLFVTIAFVFLTINSLLCSNLPIWFLPIFLIFIFSSIVFFHMKLLKLK